MYSYKNIIVNKGILQFTFFVIPMGKSSRESILKTYQYYKYELGKKKVFE